MTLTKGRRFLPSLSLQVLAALALGLIVGMIPGMTISTGIIIVLPLTFVLEPDFSIALLLGLYVSGMTGGSFSAVLLNIPGTPSASATAINSSTDVGWRTKPTRPSASHRSTRTSRPSGSGM